MSIGLYYAQVLNWLAANTVYADPLLPFIIPVSTLGVLFGAFEPTWTSIASRDLNQAKLVKIGVISNITGVLLMILLAYLISLYLVVSYRIANIGCCSSYNC